MSYKAYLEKFGLKGEETGIWTYSGDVKLSKGWKIHLSSIPVEAHKALRIFLPLVRHYGYAFKVIRDEKRLVSLDAGEYGVTQIGKFATIYVEDESRMVDFIKELVTATSELHGPEIITDLYLGGTVYMRNGVFKPRSIRYEGDKYVDYMIDLDGKRVKDAYSVPYTFNDAKRSMSTELQKYIASIYVSQPNIAPDDMIAIIKSKYHHTFNKVLYKSNTKTVYLGQNLNNPRNPHPVAIKEARKFVLSDYKGRDARDMLKKDVRIFNKVKDLMSIGDSADYFEIDGNGYGSFPFIDGKTFREVIDIFDWGRATSIEKSRMVDLLRQIYLLLQKVHDNGIVHRDVKPENFIIKNDKIFLIDFDAAYDASDSEAPFRIGTQGYLPLGEKRERKTPSVDIYSFGAIAFEVLTGLQPILLHLSNEKSIRLLLDSRVGRKYGNLTDLVSKMIFDTDFFYVDKNAIDKVLRAASRKVRQVKNFKNESYFADPVHMSIEEHNVLPQLIKIYTRVANRWLQDRLSGKKDFGTNLNEIVLYDGVAGIPIALRNAFDSRVYKDKIKQTIMLSKKLLSKYMDDTKQPTLSSGLFFGLDGIMLGNTLINEMLDIQSKKHSAGSKDSIKENTAISSRDFGYVDLISGEIGTALKRILALDMMGEGKIPINRNIIQKLSSDYQLISRRCLDKENSANEIFFGLAHGLAGVVYYLGECYSMKHDSKIGDLCLKYSDLVYQISSKKKNVCMVPVSTKNDKYRNYWCHGNPGVAISFIKAYENLHEKRYSNYIIAILNGIDEITVRNVNGLSLCHGFAGVGETYLRAAGALDDSKWLSKASEMLQIILLLMGYDGIKFVMRTKGLKYVYNEDEIVGLMTGLGGIVRFSVDYFLRDSISPAMTYPV